MLPFGLAAVAMLMFHSAVGDYTPWVSIDLGQNVLVSSFRINNRLDCCRDRLQNAEVWVQAQ